MSDPTRAQPRVSVIVVSFNTRDLLSRCLKSLRSSHRPPETEAIVVDNASADDSSGMVAGEFPEVRLILPGENLGFAKANNLAAEEARGEYLLLLNSDAAVDEDAIPELARFLDEHPSAGIVGPRLRNPDGTHQPSARTFPCPMNLFLEATGLGGLVDRTHHYGFSGDETIRVDYVSGAALMIRRNLWRELGGFEESYFFYGEDADLCWRAKEGGAETWFVHTAGAVHEGGASTAALRRDAAIEGYRAYLLFIGEHQGKAALRWARLWVFMGAALRWVVSLLPAALSPEWRRRRVTYAAVAKLALSRDPFPIGRFGWPEEDPP
jgi:hypothetical protein